ncbi:MAG TPA: hypothetical protein VFJ74_08770 [Gemmatimonadaceae bacterium]|nr:hypothetical protein [Gemmatimonadaceae bacterium]
MHVETPPRRRVEGSFNQGWGVALFVIALAIAANVAATMIHLSSYRRSPEGGSVRFGEQSRAHNATHGY